MVETLTEIEQFKSTVIDLAIRFGPNSLPRSSSLSSGRSLAAKAVSAFLVAAALSICALAASDADFAGVHSTTIRRLVRNSDCLYLGHARH
jgi:hypothetical protein